MKHEMRSLLAAVASVLASLPWGGILTGVVALLGSAGSAAATVVTGWIAPVLFCASLLMLGRSFYVIYVRKIRSRATVVVTWSSLAFMLGFWTWYLTSGGW